MCVCLRPSGRGATLERPYARDLGAPVLFGRSDKISPRKAAKADPDGEKEPQRPELADADTVQFGLARIVQYT